MNNQDDEARHDGIFRKEALDSAAGSRSYGQVLLVGDAASNWLACGCVVFVVAALVVLMTMGVSRKLTMQGVVAPEGGMIVVSSPEYGGVVRALASEGDHVVAGQPIFEIVEVLSNLDTRKADSSVVDLMSGRRDSVEEELLLRASDAQSRSRSLAMRIEEGAVQITAALSQRQIQQKKLELAMETSRTYDELSKDNYVSGVSARERRVDVLDQRASIVALDRQISAMRQESIALNEELRALRSQQAIDAVSLKRTSTEVSQQIVEASGQRTVLVRSPNAGTMGTVDVSDGQSVGGRERLAALIPDNRPLEIEMYALSNSVAFLEPGRPVTIRYASFPYQKYGKHAGTIRTVSRSASDSQTLQIPGEISGQAREPVYKVRVTPEQSSVIVDGRTMPLKPGMQVSATVELEHERLYQKILAPLFSKESKRGL